MAGRLPRVPSHPLRAQHSQGGHGWDREGHLVVTRLCGLMRPVGLDGICLVIFHIPLAVLNSLKKEKKNNKKKTPKLNIPTFSITMLPPEPRPHRSHRATFWPLLLLTKPWTEAALSSPGSHLLSNQRGGVYFLEVQRCSHAEGFRKGFCSWLWVGWESQGRKWPFKNPEHFHLPEASV